MITLTIHDPAMCCATGICGTDVDQRLVDLAADLDWLKAQGVQVQRFGLGREPAEFVANPVVHQILQDSEGDDLPVFLVDGALKAKARYPDRAELAAWTGVSGGGMAQTSACCTPAKNTPAVAAGCYGGGATAGSTPEKAGTCC